MSHEQIFEAVYKKYDGLCVGERHWEIGAKRILIQNMRKLKDMGVKTIFLEHLLYDKHQKDLVGHSIYYQ